MTIKIRLSPPSKATDEMGRVLIARNIDALGPKDSGLLDYGSSAISHFVQGILSARESFFINWLIERTGNTRLSTRAIQNSARMAGQRNASSLT